MKGLTIPVLAVTVALSGCSAGTFTANGTIYEGAEAPEGTACESDTLFGGAVVTISSDGKTVATGVLKAGHGNDLGRECDFDFTIPDVSSTGKPYEVSVEGVGAWTGVSQSVLESLFFVEVGSQDH